jgi:hypothetical protein
MMPDHQGNIVWLKDYKVDGYIGKWYVIHEYRGYYLLEHCTYGDETCGLIAVLQGDKMVAVAEIFDDFEGQVDEIIEFSVK